MDAIQSFTSLPSDIQKEILSFAVFGSVKQALRLQATSKSVKDLIWRSIIRFSEFPLLDRACTNQLLARMDKSAIKYLEIAPAPPSPKQVDFKLNLADFPALEYLSMDIQEFMPLIMDPQLKDAFMNHKTLTSVKISCTPYAQLDKNLINEISRTKKLYLRAAVLDKGSPTLSFVPADSPIRSTPAIGGFDGAPTVGCAARNFVLIGTETGAVCVLQNAGKLTAKHVVKAHQGRIHDMYSYHIFPKGNVFVASADGSVSLWDVENNFEEPRVTVKFTEPIFHVVGSLVGNLDIFVLAAGKQTVYFIDLQKDGPKEGVISVPIGEDIIRLEDLSNFVKKGFAVYTHEQIHQFSERGEKIASFKASFPDTFFGNSELHLIPHENSFDIKLVSASKKVFYDERFVKTIQRTYDARPRTCGYLDIFKLVVLSTGYGIEALDILRDRVAFSIGLPVTKKEIESKSYKHVVNIFVQGSAWFVIGSDGKLYSWQLVDALEHAYDSVMAPNFELF